MILINLLPKEQRNAYGEDVLNRFWAKVDKNGPVHERLGTRCWVWTACKIKGYGQIRIAGRTLLAHRVSWELVHGPLPVVEKYHDAEVMHACDNPACVRPEHLELGTHADNLRDMVNRGRHFSRTRPERIARGERHMSRTKPETVARGDRNGARKHPEKLSRGDSHYSRVTPEKLARGESNGNARLDKNRVRQIRTRSAAGESDEILGAAFDVHPDTVKQVRTRKTWKHVP